MTEQRFHSVEGSTGRTLTGRLLPGADLMEGLEAVCDHHGVTYAAVNFCYGSLARAGFKVLQRPEGAQRPSLHPTSVERQVEFLGGQGLVCGSPEGGRITHLHGSVADETGAVLGGHFLTGENPIYNNLDFSLVELLDVRLVRRYDPETEHEEMIVEQEESA